MQMIREKNGQTSRLYTRIFEFGRHLLFVILLVCPAVGFTCEVKFRKPKTYFNGVNEFGYVSYWDQIGELDLEDGYKLPLIIGFRSDWNKSSPYLGYGWFCFLDSHFVQRSENTFDLIQLDGYTFHFARDRKNPSILHSVGGWKAEVKNNTITAYAACGWKTYYVGGKVASITTPKNKTLEIHRDSAGTATSASIGPREVFKVERELDGQISAFLYYDKQIKIKDTDKPRIQKIQGQPVIAGVDQAVGEIVQADGTVKTFSYSPTDVLQPSIVINKRGEDPRRLVWDSESFRIVSDSSGGWVYQIDGPPGGLGYAKIERKSDAGNLEGWQSDPGRGREVITKSSGIKVIKSWFTNGLLSGKIRSIDISRNGTTQSVLLLSYDEKGKAIRRRIANGVTEVFERDAEGNVISVTKEREGKPIGKTIFDKQGEWITEEKNGLVVRERIQRKGAAWEGAIAESIKSAAMFLDTENIAYVEGTIGPKSKWTYDLFSAAGVRLGKINSAGEVVQEFKEAASGSDFSTTNGITRRFSRKLSDTQWEEFHYGSDGALRQTQRGLIDKANRMKRITIVDQRGKISETVYREDEKGRIVEYTAHGRTIKYKYDADGKRSQETVVN